MEDAVQRTDKRPHLCLPYRADLRLLPDGSVDREFYKRRAQELRCEYWSTLMRALLRQVSQHLTLFARWVTGLAKSQPNARQAR